VTLPLYREVAEIVGDWRIGKKGSGHCWQPPGRLRPGGVVCL
jgi:hypothetical protein